MGSTYELKGQLVSIIGRLEDERLLKDILEFIENLAKNVDDLEDMPSEAIAELELAIKESYETKTGASHDEFIQNEKQWLLNQK